MDRPKVMTPPPRRRQRPIPRVIKTPAPPGGNGPSQRHDPPSPQRALSSGVLAAACLPTPTRESDKERNG
eukprot:316801-Chlamydomonas_euryale.AAC.1